MAALFLDVALRATLITAGTACVLWALRVRTAAERHAAWTAVLVCMLLLPIYSLAGPKLPFAVVPGTATSPEFDPGASAEARTGGAGLSLTPLALVADTAPRHVPAAPEVLGSSSVCTASSPVRCSCGWLSAPCTRAGCTAAQ